jgi:GNAT superfamily N-acetyltransferase
MVRRASAQERTGVVATVVAAFAEDPAWAFMFGEQYERLAPDFAGALFDVRVASDDVWVLDDLAAVAMWDSPEKSDAVSRHAESVWERYRAGAGEDVLDRVAIYNAAVAAAASVDPHWYLGVLATHPQRRREGLASAVLAPILEQADGLGLWCCLETSTIENRRFYEHRGFTEATDVILPGGPTTWWLRRRPSRQ